MLQPQQIYQTFIPYRSSTFRNGKAEGPEKVCSSECDVLKSNFELIHSDIH